MDALRVEDGSYARDRRMFDLWLMGVWLVSDGCFASVGIQRMPFVLLIILICCSRSYSSQPKMMSSMLMSCASWGTSGSIWKGKQSPVRCAAGMRVSSRS